MKKFKNLFLIFSSIIFILILLELVLIISGTYSQLTKTNLKPAISVFERPKNVDYHIKEWNDKNHINIAHDIKNKNV